MKKRKGVAFSRRVAGARRWKGVASPLIGGRSADSAPEVVGNNAVQGRRLNKWRTGVT